MDYVEYVYSCKERIIKQVEGLLSEREIEVARRDPHAKRPPRPCGITIHPGIGCPYACRYCYVYDMGFTQEVKPSQPNGLQLVYALLANKYFIPGARGSYLAIGSVTEPFHPLLKNKTLEYIEAIYRFLGNPTQFSTKQYIDPLTAEKIAEYSSNHISPLVTLVTLEKHRELEPNQVKPEKRLETIKNLREAGLKPFLFLRPIIPGITQREYREIIDLALENGAVGVVAGGLRVTRRIIERLREAGVDPSEITRRLPIPVEKMKPGVQYDIYTSDIKNEVLNYARKKGLIAYPSSCMANLYTHGLTCWKMSILQKQNNQKLEEPSPEELSRIIEKLGGRLENYVFQNGSLNMWIKCRKCDGRLIGEVVRSRFLTCTKVFTKRG